MSGRIKLLLALLAVGTGLVFWYITYSSLANTTTATISDAIATSTESTARCSDQDSDGLCDYDETYWRTDFKNPDTDGDGFKDGEEVLSGHSPVKAGPDDFLNDKRNLTQRTSALLLGGVAAGDLDPKSANYNASVDTIVDQILEQYAANVTSEIDSFVVTSSSTETITTYSYKLSTMLQQMFAEISRNHEEVLLTLKGVPSTEIADLARLHPETARALATAANNEALAFNDRIRLIRSLRVPTTLQSYHRSLLVYLRGTQQRYLALKNISTDPLGAILSLQVLETLAVGTPLDLTLSLRDTVAKALTSK